MIVVTGIEGTSEHQTALAIQSSLAKLWPGSEISPADDELIQIAAGAKISGYKISDIDVLIAARLRPGRAFGPRRAVRDRNGVRVVGPIKVINFVAAIEVKDHDPSRVRVIGDSIEVRYARNGPPKWSSAVQQNVDQAHAIKAYFEHQHASVFVHRAVIMRGFDKVPCSGALGGTFDGTAFLTALAETSPVAQSGREMMIRSSAQPEIIDKVLSAPVFRTLTPTSLDRKRMDRIVTGSYEIDGYLETLGAKMQRLRGRGGTGKTVMLLQLAWRAFNERSSRSVVLTYNHALASDIRRLMALMNVPSDPAEGGIAVRTVMSFVTAWLGRLGLIEVVEEGLGTEYEAQCTAALEMIQQGALLPGDIEAVKLAEPEIFAFDYVLADEAQDWPAPELELIKALYAPESICLADGVDQLVRGGASNWERGISEGRRTTVSLKRCLRMKANLAVFANALSEQASINWKVEPNKDARGGRVILLVGPLAHRQILIRSLLDDACKAGNAPIDTLFCVPPTGVIQDADGTRSSRLGATLRLWNYDVWDGADLRKRRDFPRSQDCLRVVQYASCRGLEGWTVLLDSLDQHWTWTRSEALGQVRPAGDLESPSDGAWDRAWRQCLIPLSRAIDTLVIGIDNPSSEAAKILLAVAHSNPDIVEVLGAPTVGIAL